MNWIKSNWKNVLIGLLIIAIIVSTRSCSNNADSYASEKIKDSIRYNNNVKQWKDKYGKEHTTVEQYRLSEKVFKEHADSVSRELNVRAIQIQSLTDVNVKLKLKISGFRKDTILVHIVARDSSGNPIDSTPVIKQINFEWPGSNHKGTRWIEVKGTIGEVDSLEISGIDSLQLTEYWKRKWFLGNKTYYTDVKNKNPYIHVTELKAVRSMKQDPKWLIAPSFQLGYGSGTKSWMDMRLQVGVSLIYYPLSIKIK